MSEATLSIPRRVVLALILWYQRVLSPDHSPRKVLYPHGYCRFSPTCSEYSADAVRKYGVIKGSFLGLWRIIRCNPWSKGGFDPVK
jgi:putative membrane protein insertion efficiency factor